VADQGPATAPRFALDWFDPDEAENVATVLIEAGTRGEEIIDHGFYDDGRSLMEQVAKWRAAQWRAARREDPS
jgi:hypothetical protein